jgi:hypothetical protein
MVKSSVQERLTSTKNYRILIRFSGIFHSNYSTGRNLSRQTAPGQAYGQIEKVVTIVITNYDIIGENNFYHHIFKLYAPEKRIIFTDIM